jgi:hypothetical protein
MSTLVFENNTQEAALHSSKIAVEAAVNSSYWPSFNITAIYVSPVLKYAIWSVLLAFFYFL